MVLVTLFYVINASAQGTCISCHQEIGDEMAAPIDLVKNDVHGHRGFSCVSCHGGDPKINDVDASMDPKKGFVGKPEPRQVAAFCGKCHSNAEFMKQFNPALRIDQQSEYTTSVHGKRIAQGDVRPATCISCHGAHGVRPVKDPNSPVYPTRVATTCGGCHSNPDTMKPYGIPTDQAAKYLKSVHAEALLKKQDLSAPTCNDCHGNHGAAPPGTASVGNVCGTCHMRQSELFAESPHQSAFDALGIPQCLACHSNHEVQHPTDASLGVESKAVCVTCHDKGEPGYATAQAMHNGLSTLDGEIAASRLIVDRAARAGMEVSGAGFDLNDARDKLINSRVMVHSFSTDELMKAVEPGRDVARKARRAGEDALQELQFRRKGLAISLLVIGMAITGVYLKIRQIEGRSS
jgi:predicted CXXCH cytochrome family protein